MTDALARAGELAIAEAEQLWLLDVSDPSARDQCAHAISSRAVITSIVEACGWTWEVPYRGNGQVEWCVMFAGACWRKAGLDPKWLAAFFASTMRLGAWARYLPWNEHQNPRPAGADLRLCAWLGRDSTSVPFEPRAGDILTIGDGIPAEGDHCTIVVSYDPVARIFETLEGNGVGIGPDGKSREGIVRAHRRVGGDGYCARMLVRPAPGDLIP